MIPRNWNEVSIETYQILEKTFNEKPQTLVELHDLRVKRAIILSGLSHDELFNTDLDACDKLINTPIPTKIPRFFRFKGNLYKTILDPTRESAGRNMNVMNACKNPDDIARILFSVVKPVKGIWRKETKLSATEIRERIEEFKQLPVSIAMPIKVFFCNISTELTNVILQYSDETMSKMKNQMDQQANSLKDLAGQSL